MALIVIAFILVALGGMTQLQFDDGTRSIFSSSRPEFQAYSEHVEAFAQSDTVAVMLVSADDPFDPRSLTHLRNIVLEAQTLEGVEGVFSVFGVNTLHPIVGDISEIPPNDLAQLPNIQSQGSAGRNYIGGERSMLSDDRRQTVIIVSLADVMQDLTTAKPTLDALEAIAARSAQNGLTVELTGMLPIRQWIIAGIVRDQAVINIVAAIVGFFISLVLFRSFWIAVLNGVAPVVALTMSLGAFGLFGFEINTVRNALPILILVLAMADCIHMTFEFCREASESRDLDRAIMRMIKELAPACILTSLTTIIAFASLYYSESPLIQSLSISGILAVAIALLVVLFVHPLVFVLAWKFGPARAAFQRSGDGFLQSFRTGKLMTVIVKLRLPMASFGLALGVGLLIVFLPVKTDFRFYEYVENEERIVHTLERAEEIAGPTQAIDIPLRLADSANHLSDETLEDALQIHANISQAFPGYPIVSVDSVVRILEERGERASWNNVQLALAPLPSIVSDSIVSRDGDALLVRLMTVDQHSQEVRDLADRIEALPEPIGTSSVSVGEPTGLTVVAARLSDTMIKQLTISFLIAAMLCPLLIALWFRRWDFGVAAILPNMLPIMAVGAWLNWTGWHMQFTSALALAIAFGIAVDDTIHVLNRLSLQEKEKGKRDDGSMIVVAMDKVAPALIATTLILLAGLVATMFSTMPTARFFGQICMSVFVLALIADLLILPAILAIIVRWRRVKLPS